MYFAIQEMPRPSRGGLLIIARARIYLETPFLPFLLIESRMIIFHNRHQQTPTRECFPPGIVTQLSCLLDGRGVLG